jgi:hypothetical protein
MSIGVGREHVPAALIGMAGALHPLRLQKADCLVTRNARDFEPALLPVFQPVEFLGTFLDTEKRREGDVMSVTQPVTDLRGGETKRSLPDSINTITNDGLGGWKCYFCLVGRRALFFCVFR